MTHARSVLQGISGSSVLATAERTSGYGESSSSAWTSKAPLGSCGNRWSVGGRQWWPSATAHVKVGDRKGVLVGGALLVGDAVAVLALDLGRHDE
jgi:hypothetical protein